MDKGATAPALHDVATEYYRLGIFDRAMTYVSRALGLNPRATDSFELRARIWRDWNEPELALADAHRATYLAPQSASARNTLGTVLFALGRKAEAAEAFKAALSLAPDAAWASNNLCYVSLSAGDEVSALAQCSAALTVDPDLVVARNNLGLIHAAAGRFDDAAREFRASGPVAGHYNLGIVLMAKGEYARAQSEFEAALREAPGLDAAFARAQEARALAANQNRVK